MNSLNFSISNNLTQMVNFPIWIPDCDSHNSTFWIYLFLLMLAFVLQWLHLHWEILIMLLSQFQLNFRQTQNRMFRFIVQLIAIHVLIGAVFVINFVCGFRLELMYIPLIVNVRSSLTHFHGFQQLVLLLWFVEITFFVCTNRINLLNLK